MKKLPILSFSLLLLVLPLLLSCYVSKVPTDCTQIEEEALRALDFGTMTLVDLQRWFNSSHFRAGKLEVVDHLDESRKSATWMYRGIEYRASFRDGILVSIDVDWDQEDKVVLEPTSAQIIGCLGPPDLYQASYLTHIETKIFNLGLWYPNRGVVIHGTHFGMHWVDWSGRRPPPVDGYVTMGYMTIVAPGTVEEMIKNVYIYGEKDEVQEKVLKTLRSWPGGWEKIVVDTEW